MFIKRSSPKLEKATISSKLKRCSKCGKPFLPECEDGICPMYCPLCAKIILEKSEKD